MQHSIPQISPAIYNYVGNTIRDKSRQPSAGQLGDYDFRLPPARRARKLQARPEIHHRQCAALKTGDAGKASRGISRIVSRTVSRIGSAGGLPRRGHRYQFFKRKDAANMRRLDREIRARDSKREVARRPVCRGILHVMAYRPSRRT